MGAVYNRGRVCWMRAGVSEKVAMRMVGLREMLDRYHIVSQADLREAAKRLDAVRR